MFNHESASICGAILVHSLRNDVQVFPLSAANLGRRFTFGRGEKGKCKIVRVLDNPSLNEAQINCIKLLMIQIN